MKSEYILTALFFLIVAIFFYLFYQLMVPFFTPIAWAAILVIVFYPVYGWLQRRIKSPSLASLVASVLMFIIIIGPSIYLMASLVGETANLLQLVNEAYQNGTLKDYLTMHIPFVDSIKNKLSDYPQLANVDFESIIKDAVSTITKAIGAQATTVIANISKSLFYFVLMLFSMFYFFRDGDYIVDFLKKITPLKRDQVSILYKHMKEVIEGTMYGGLVIAILQGLLGGILFAIMGISSPVLWGSVMAFLAFIPVVGPSLVYIPAGIIMLLTGSPIKGIIILAVGAGISQTDNFLRPHLFSGKTEMHTLLMFFSIMGGIVMFGLLGIVLGPLIAAVFVSLLKVFEVSIRSDKAASRA